MAPAEEASSKEVKPKEVAGAARREDEVCQTPVGKFQADDSDDDLLEEALAADVPQRAGESSGLRAAASSSSWTSSSAVVTGVGALKPQPAEIEITVSESSSEAGAELGAAVAALPSASAAPAEHHEDPRLSAGVPVVDQLAPPRVSLADRLPSATNSEMTSQWQHSERSTSTAGQARFALASSSAGMAERRGSGASQPPLAVSVAASPPQPVSVLQREAQRNKEVPQEDVALAKAKQEEALAHLADLEADLLHEVAVPLAKSSVETSKPAAACMELPPRDDVESLTREIFGNLGMRGAADPSTTLVINNDPSATFVIDKQDHGKRPSSGSSWHARPSPLRGGVTQKSSSLMLTGGKMGSKGVSVRVPVLQDLEAGRYVEQLGLTPRSGLVSPVSLASPSSRTSVSRGTGGGAADMDLEGMLKKLKITPNSPSSRMSLSVEGDI